MAYAQALVRRPCTEICILKKNRQKLVETYRFNELLLSFVVLCAKAQNGFCPMCTKGCCIVLTRPKPFWGQFWGQIRETDSDLHRSNKCTALVSLRNMNVLILRYTLDNQELANLSLSRTSQALGSKLL